MTSALLFVALLIVVDLSYRRWVRRSLRRRMKTERRASTAIDLAEAEAIAHRDEAIAHRDDVIAFALRDDAARAQKDAVIKKLDSVVRRERRSG